MFQNLAVNMASSPLYEVILWATLIDELKSVQPRGIIWIFQISTESARNLILP